LSYGPNLLLTLTLCTTKVRECPSPRGSFFRQFLAAIRADAASSLSYEPLRDEEGIISKKSELKKRHLSNRKPRSRVPGLETKPGSTGARAIGHIQRHHAGRTGRVVRRALRLRHIDSA